jgi:hypothetical protein
MSLETLLLIAYAACVEDSSSMSAYETCRAEVDTACLDDDGGVR